MHVNLCTPLLFGRKVTSRVPGRLEMTVVVRGVFRLTPGQPVTPITDLALVALQDDVYADADDERTGALLHASDFADHKARTDLLLRATCYPGAQPARVCAPSFGVGTWSKTLRVIGRRVWTDGLLDAISDPEPFTSMPLTYENAFGGPGFERNPVGKGYKTKDLPTVEDPAHLVRSRRDAPDPAGFAPFSPAWPQRSKKRGTQYGPSWKKTRAPFYAADFDWSYFNAAPLDQQRAYLRGDEELSFEFLHPQVARFTATLPGLRPRVFARRTDGFAGEVPLNLDTLIADVDGERLILLWRGLVEVHDDQLDDVSTLFIESEPLDAPRPVAEHLAELERFDADPVAFYKSRLFPADAMKKLEDARAEKAKVQAEDQAEAAARAAAPSDPAGRLRAAVAGGRLKDQPPEQARALEGLLDRLADFTKKSEARLAELKAQSGANDMTVDGLYGAAAELLATLKEKALARGVASEGVDLAEKQLAAAREQGTASGAEEVAPGPGANLMERDLAGRDLRGLDLRKARLRKARLAGAKLAGANLAGADLSDAELEGADLSGADLSRASLLGAHAPRAVFDGAKLAQTIFAKADLTGASLVEVKGTMVAFQETKLASACFHRSHFDKAYFGQAQLDGADFSGAELVISGFLEVSAAGILFDQAILTKVCFVRCKMAGASFYRATGFRSSWQGSTLDGADFRYARLREAQLNKASLEGAMLFASDFRGSRFERSSLARADFGRADLMSVSFCKARLDAADFSGASLYDAKFLGALATDKCKFDGANLASARWEQS